MARFYTYVNPAEIEAQFDNEDEKKNAEKMNIYSTVPPVSQTQMWMSGSKWRMDWGPEHALTSVPWWQDTLMGKTSELWTKKALFQAASNEPKPQEEVFFF